MAVMYDVVSIGCLSRNRFWDEPGAVRVAHATTTLLREDNHCILVDPSLPEEVLVHRLNERAGIRPEDIDCVMLTSFSPVHRRGLRLFNKADWLAGTVEIQAVRAHLTQITEMALQAGDTPDDLVADELALLDRVKPAPDKLTRSVHLFPSPGPTTGHCSLLLTLATTTLVVAGDVIATRDYYDHARVFEHCRHIEQARESFAELAELADQIIPGHDNLFVPINRY